MKKLTADDVRIEENALADLQFALIDEMRAQNVTKADLADRLGVSRSRVSQLLSPDANPTLKLVARALNALGLSAEYVSKIEAPVSDGSEAEKSLFENIVLEDRRFAHQWGVSERFAANENADHGHTQLEAA